jgi:hypothetical protein
MMVSAFLLLLGAALVANILLDRRRMTTLRRITATLQETHTGISRDLGRLEESRRQLEAWTLMPPAQEAEASGALSHVRATLLRYNRAPEPGLLEQSPYVHFFDFGRALEPGLLEESPEVHVLDFGESVIRRGLSYPARPGWDLTETPEPAVVDYEIKEEITRGVRLTVEGELETRYVRFRTRILPVQPRRRYVFITGAASRRLMAPAPASSLKASPRSSDRIAKK